MSESPTLPVDGDKKPGRPSRASLDAEAEQLAKDREAFEAERREHREDHDRNVEMREAALDKMTGSRQAVADAPDEKGFDSRKSRKPIGAVKRLDADKYQRAYPDKKLVWENDMDGRVQRWIDAGAEPVPVDVKGDRVFEGITDRHESQWVRAIGGDDGHGNVYQVYLLMMAPELYDELVTEPERHRLEEIRRAMKGGGDQSDDRSGPKLPSYAPNLPTGIGTGIDTTHDSVG